MKRFLLSGSLALALAQVASAQSAGYTNNDTIQVPPLTWDAAFPPNGQIDAVNFVNNGFFSVTLTQPFSSTYLFQTSDTLNYINNGKMVGNPGFDFRTFPSSVGSARMAASFVNSADNGNNGGIIQCQGFDSLGNGVFSTNGIFNLAPSTLIVSATNIQSSGLISMDNYGLMQFTGENVDFSRGTLSMPQASGTSSTFGISALDYALGVATNGFWDPSTSLSSSQASSASFFVGNAFVPQVLSFNNTKHFYFTFTSGASDSRTNSLGAAIVDNTYAGIYINDTSPASVSIQANFSSSSSSQVQWAGGYTNPITKVVTTRYFTLSDLFHNLTNAVAFGGLPSNYRFPNLGSAIAAGSASVTPPPYTPESVTNNYSYLKIQLIATPKSISTIGNYPTNLPGRIYISAKNRLNLTNAQINAGGYLSLQCTNQFEGNSGAFISSPNSDFKLGSAIGALSVSNLVVPTLSFWSGGLEAWSISWEDDPADPTQNGTNYFNVLLIKSSLNPTTLASQQDVVLHATNNLTVSDPLNISGNFQVDATALTITTNGAGSFAPVGALNFTSPNSFWSGSAPRLQFLTNWGVISTVNLADFALNVQPPYYVSADIPYQAMVNHGRISNQGTYIRARYFENTGLIQESTNGNVDVIVGTASMFNGGFTARGVEGSIRVAGNSLAISNHTLLAASGLTLAATNLLTDGFKQGNRYGLPPNANTIATNLWLAGGSFNLLFNPLNGDLLATTISNRAPTTAHPNVDTTSRWAGRDRGAVLEGFTNNVALGRLVLDGGSNAVFTLSPVNCSNALYVDSIEFVNAATNTDAAGNLAGVSLTSGMKIYYAQALVGGRDFGQQLNGKNGGGFNWVSNYAGLFSSTNVLVGGAPLVLNRQLVLSTNITWSTNFTATLPPSDPANYCGMVASGSGGGSGGGGGGAGGPGSTMVAQTPPLPAEADTAALTASFSRAQGRYNGLFYDTNGVTVANGGSFTASTYANRSFKAAFNLAGGTYVLNSTFDVNGHYLKTNAILRTGKSPLSVDLQLDLDGDGQITGTVRSTNWAATLYADRAGFSAAAPTPARGQYTLVVPGTPDGTNLPAGAGFGTVTVNADGTLSWSLKLADGTTVPSQTSALSKQGYWPLFYAYPGGTGLIMGWLQFTNTFIPEGVEWPAVWIKSPTVAAKYYPAGFASAVSITGSYYTNGSPMLNYTSGILVTSDGNLGTPLTNQILFSPGGLGLDPVSKRQILHVVPYNGLFLGSLPGRVSLFQGALLRDGGSGSGWGSFFGTNQSGQVYFGPAP